MNIYKVLYIKILFARSIVLKLGNNIFIFQLDSLNLAQKYLRYLSRIPLSFMQIEVSLHKLQLFLAGYLSARAAVPYSPVHFPTCFIFFFLQLPLIFFSAVAPLL